MAVAEVAPAHERFASPQHEVWRGRAFGIALESRDPFPGLPFCADTRAGRIATWHEERAWAIDEAWALEDGEILVDLRHTDGRVFMRIDRHHGDGYRIWAPYYGRHLISADGRAIRSALPNVSPWRWQRLFFAQTLPLAAALQGLQLVRASAVGVHGRVVAFAGAPSSGKTSVAAHAVALGASFVTDDVLAVEGGGTTVVAHPGPARLSMEECELRRVPDGQRERLGLQIGRSDKLMIEPTPIAAGLPLGAVYVLRRPAAEVSRLTIAEAGTSAARAVMDDRPHGYVAAPEQLDVLTMIAEQIRVYDVLIPQGARAREVAATTLAHADRSAHAG